MRHGDAYHEVRSCDGLGREAVALRAEDERQTLQLPEARIAQLEGVLTEG